MEFNIKEEVKKLPLRSGVYIMYDKKSSVLYVGKAKKLKNRVSSYFRKNAGHSKKIELMVRSVYFFEYIVTDSEVEALILENNLIKQHKPPYNTMLKDDKTYPYIKVTISEAFPRVFITREYKKDGSKYYGPYASAYSAKEVVEIVRKLYKIRTCSRNLPRDIGKERPCLYHHIGECEAPCAGLVPENIYKQKIDKVLSFLKGHYDSVIKDLSKEMSEYSENMEFEKAAEIRDQINSIKQLSIKQKVVSLDNEDRDVIGFARGEKEVIVQVFFIRGGKLIAKEHYRLDHIEDFSDKEVLTSFVKQFYSTVTYVPKEILLQIEIDDKEVISSWLSEKRTKSLEIKVPLKGEKYKLVKLASLNATHLRNQYSEKIRKEQRRTRGAVDLLEELIGAEDIQRIESYDISNISGAYSVASMVVFIDGVPKKSDYRKFRIKDVVGSDDYKSLEEVLTRRFERGLKEQVQILKNELELSRGKFNILPDLILMDGGKGQISAAKKVLDKFGLDILVCGMVKDDKHRTRGLIYEGKMLEIEKNGELFRFITRVQDETHRFAITYHSKLRNEEMIKSELNNIKGVGEQRRKILMKRFASVKKISEQSVESLASVDGISAKLAQEIYAYFHTKVD